MSVGGVVERVDVVCCFNGTGSGVRTFNVCEEGVGRWWYKIRESRATTG